MWPCNVVPPNKHSFLGMPCAEPIDAFLTSPLYVACDYLPGAPSAGTRWGLHSTALGGVCTAHWHDLTLVFCIELSVAGAMETQEYWYKFHQHRRASIFCGGMAHLNSHLHRSESTGGAWAGCSRDSGAMSLQATAVCVVHDWGL